MRRRSLLIFKLILSCACCFTLPICMVSAGHALTKSDHLGEDGAPKGLPKTRTIEVIVKGIKEEREASLFVSNLGYYMYVLPTFVASGEEPGKDILFFKADDRFMARIEKVGSNPDLNQLRQSAERELAELGRITDLTKMGGKLDPFLGKSAVYLKAASNQTIKEIIVFPVGAVWFKVTRFLVNTKAAEEVEPAMLAMLKTITVKE